MANGGDFVQIMEDKAQKRPSKGILKTSTSFEKQEKASKKNNQKATKWDEMNIIATLHPPDKDYGHMKIEEPKTPYNWDLDDDEDEVDGHQQHVLDPAELAAKLKGKLDRSRKDAFEDVSDDSDTDLTAEELARRKVFKSKRKMHYNEFKVVEFARKLIKADEEALENEDLEEADDRPTSSNKSMGDGDVHKNTLDCRLKEKNDRKLQEARKKRKEVFENGENKRKRKRKWRTKEKKNLMSGCK